MCAYFSPYIDENGLHLPTYNDILEKRIADAKSIFGQDIYLGNDSLDYQAIAVEALSVYDCMQAIQLAYNQFSPVTAIGVGLSSLVQLNGLTRQAASYSTCDVILTGTTSSTIVNGVILDQAGNSWSLPTPITLQASGSPIGSTYTLVVTATCQTIGAITALPGDLNTISTPTAGWTSVTNTTAATAGQPVETDSQLRARQALSVALPSQTMLAGTTAAIASLAEVTRYKLYENATNSTHYGDSGVPFEGSPVHSITCIVEGGDQTDVATAIYNNRGIGCYMDGDVEIDIADPVYGNLTTVRFYRPVYVPIYVEIEIHALNGYTSDAIDDIKEAVADYINTLDIGQTLALSSVIGAAVAVMVNSARPTFSVYTTVMGTDPSSPPLDNSDIVVAYNEVVSGDEANITVTLV
jgi:uncharacterized phage protein gp47/JayE